MGLPAGLHQQRRAHRRPCPLDRALQHSTPPQRTRRASSDQPAGTNLMAGYSQPGRPNPQPPPSTTSAGALSCHAAGMSAAAFPAKRPDEVAEYLGRYRTRYYANGYSLTYEFVVFAEDADAGLQVEYRTVAAEARGDDAVALAGVP